MERYEYSGLDDQGQEIRLLTLLPGRYLDNVRVTLENVALDTTSPPFYEALSYTWGSAQDTVPICILTETVVNKAVHKSPRWFKKILGSSARIHRDNFHGVPFSSLDVTRNLTVALQHLRYKKEPRILWVDAICINQQDAQERSAQVQRMGEIYQSAHQTTIWLGPEGDASSLAMETLDDLGSKVTVDWGTLTTFSQEGTALADSVEDLPLDERQRTSIIRPP
ncbi:MAG: hypothetical protein Q9226_007132 [Calogaya cf. arnoldii]